MFIVFHCHVLSAHLQPNRLHFFIILCYVPLSFQSRNFFSSVWAPPPILPAVSLSPLCVRHLFSVSLFGAPSEQCFTSYFDLKHPLSHSTLLYPLKHQRVNRSELSEMFFYYITHKNFFGKCINYRRADTYLMKIYFTSLQKSFINELHIQSFWGLNTAHSIPFKEFLL